MRDRPRRGLLLGAGRRVTLQLLQTARRADEDLREIIGKTSEELCAICPNNTTAAEKQRVAVEAREVFRNITYRIDSASNGARYFGFSGQPVFDQRRRFKGYRGIAVDVTVQMRAERLTQLEHSVSRILAEAEDVKVGIALVIETMCASEQWTAGNFWTVDEAGALRHLVAWTPADKGPQSVLAEDAALPSWLNAGPVWIGDVGRSGEPPRKARPRPGIPAS